MKVIFSLFLLNLILSSSNALAACGENDFGIYLSQKGIVDLTVFSMRAKELRAENDFATEVSRQQYRAIQDLIDSPRRFLNRVRKVYLIRKKVYQAKAPEVGAMNPKSYDGIVMRWLAAEILLARNISPMQMKGLWQAHLTGKPPYSIKDVNAKTRILEKHNFSKAERFILLNLQIAGDVKRYERRFSVRESPSDAQRVINAIEISDAVGMQPPGVSLRKAGPGHFVAESPFARFESILRASGNGQVVEYNTIEAKGAATLVGLMTGGPIGAMMAGPATNAMAHGIHNIFTSPETGYTNARRRVLGY